MRISLSHLSYKVLFTCLTFILLLNTIGLGQTSSKKNPQRKSNRSKVEKKRKPTSLIDEYKLDFSDLWTSMAGMESHALKYFHRPNTIKKLSNDIIQVWIKMELKDSSDLGRAENLRNRKMQGLRTLGYEKYSHTLELDELNCTKGEMRVLSRIDYDDEGSAIDSVSYKNSSWDYVIPESIGESLLKAVCSQRNK